MEEWKEIFDGYLVSTLGNVYSTKLGKRRRQLKQTTDKDGYLHVNLKINCKDKRFAVHRLVAMAFIPNPENKPEVNHINGIKNDNCVENLEWATRSENQRHAFSLGLQNPVNAKLTDEQVIYIRENPDSLTQKQLSKKFNVDTKTIGDVLHGEKYKKVGGTISPKQKYTRLADVEARNQIRLEYASSKTCSQRFLAKKYGISQCTVWKILHEK